MNFVKNWIWTDYKNKDVSYIIKFYFFKKTWTESCKTASCVPVCTKKNKTYGEQKFLVSIITEQKLKAKSEIKKFFIPKINYASYGKTKQKIGKNF